MRNEKGITLATLVISIIVLLILASILVYSGVSTIRYTNYNKAKAEIETLQTNINSWYDEYIKIEVTEEEISEGQTREQVLANKHQQFLNHYGVLPSDPSCDQTKLNNTIQGVQENGYNIVANNFIFLSSQKINDTLGLNFTFDYLVNIPSRKVILFNGILYNGKRYYTAEDFGILNVEYNALNTVNFNLVQGDCNELFIYNLRFFDAQSHEYDVSKFRVSISEHEANLWKDITNEVTKTTYNGKKAYHIANLEYKKYDVKISTLDNKTNQQTIELIEPRAIFKVGQEVNAKMKQLAGTTNATDENEDTNIKEIKRAKEISNENKIESNIVSTPESTTPIYMWYDSETIYYYTKADKPSLNVNASYMFRKLKAVENIELNTIDTKNTTNMQALFESCSSLRSIDVSNFDTSNVTNMYALFSGSMENNIIMNLREIIGIENFNTSNVTTMNRMFYKCNSLTSLDISEFDMTNVTDTVNMLYGSTSLTELKTPKAYPTGTSITIALPKTLYDESNNGYTTLNSSSPIQTWLRTNT